MEVPQILAQHDVALIPQKANIYGTFPAKTYEAMAVGLPILFHGGEAGSKLVLDNQIGLVSKPKDWEKLKQNISEMAKFDVEKSGGNWQIELGKLPKVYLTETRLLLILQIRFQKDLRS